MSEKIDRRISKTKKSLKTALAELLARKSLHNISVKELTEIADIHRGTFYTHYQDIYDLFQQIENEVFEKISEELKFDPAHNYTGFFTFLFDFAEKNTTSFKVLYSTHSDSSFHNRFCSFFEEKLTDVCLADEDMTAETMPERWKYLIHYSSAGFISLLERWIQSGFEYPKAELVELAKEIDLTLDSLY